LRFPEFTGKWEKKKLGDIANVYDGTHQTQNYVNEGVRFLSVEDISSKGAQSKYITEEAFNKDFKIKPQKDDILMTRITAGIIGETSIVKTNEPIAYYVSLALIRRTRQISPEYLSSYINSNHFKYELHKRIIHVAFPKKINLNDLEECKVSYPKLDEQKKIASFLSLIEERISTQNKIIEDLKMLKSTISEKLFNRVLRFNKQGKNAYLNWELRKFRDFLSIPDKIPIDQINKNKLLTVKLHLKGVMKNDSTESLSISGTTYYFRKKGQFIFGKQNLFNGAFGIIPDEYDGFLSSNDVPTLDINHNKINPLYLLYYMGRRNYYVPLESIAIGSGSKRIHETTLLNLEIAVPTLEEQTSIVSTIYSIEKKFNLEISVLQNFNIQKKYLLSNLFV
jgi:type I restriction enzyme S subunit